MASDRSSRAVAIVIVRFIMSRRLGLRSFKRCFATEYFRNSKISDSDISPSHTVEVPVHLRAAPRELRNAGAGVVIQKRPDVPGFPGSFSFYPTIRDLER